MFFGSFRAVWDDGSPLQFSTRSARALLIYLAMQPDQPFTREHLAALLWPEATREQAQTNLRQTLYRLRQSLTRAGATAEYLSSDATTVSFPSRSNYWLDVRAFDELLRQVAGHIHRRLDECHACTEHMQRAITLYDAGLLTGFTLPDAPGFEEWRVLHQERLHNRTIATLETLAAYHQRQRDWRAAAAALSRILALEPWREETHVALMRAYLQDGKRHLALQQYEILARTLAAELHVQPGADAEALHAQICAGLTALQPTLHPRVNPYCGLNAFGQEQASFFFGREEMVARLAAEVERRPLLLLVGVSGSGKSSLIHAGLLPALLEATPGRVQHVCVLRPGEDPYVALAGALAPLLPHIDSMVLADDLRTGARSLAQVIQVEMLDNAPTTSLIILLDQFEELFQGQRVDFLPHHFLHLLATTATTNFSPHHAALVLALRADFLGQALAHGAFANAIQEAIFVLGALSRTEMARAVELPAQMQNVHFAPGLVEQLLDDVGDEPGRLPLLQFCLTRLWQQQRDGWIGHAAYGDIEGLAGALNHYADGVLARLQPAQQTLARRVLLRLVHVQEDVEPSRRLGLRAEFSAAEWAVVQALTSARLLVTDRTPRGEESVELVHEALIRNWTRLGEWLHADRAFFFWREGLRASVRLWERAGRDCSALLRGGLLAEAEIKVVDRWNELSQAETDFVTASLALRLEEAAAAAQRQEQERARAAALAEALASRTQALHDAQRATALAQSHGLISAARLALVQRETDNALRLAVQALTFAPPTAEVELTLSDAAYAPGTIRCFHSHGGAIFGVACYPDGRRAVLGAADGTMSIWDLNSGGQLMHLSGHSAAVRAVQVSGDGRHLLSASADGSLAYWDAENGRLKNRLCGHMGVVYAACFHPDGRRALSCGADGRVLLWDLAAGREIGRFDGHRQPVYALAISPDGNRALSSDAHGTVIHWTVPEGEILHRFPGYLERGADSDWMLGHIDAAWGVAFVPGSETAISVSQDQFALLWDLREGKQLRRYSAIKAGLFAVACSPDGRAVLLGGLDSRMALLDLESGVFERYLGHTGRLYSLATTLDGRYVLSGAADGAARLWDLRNGAEIRRIDYRGHDSAAAALDISSDERLGATATFAGEIILWDVNKGVELRRLVGHTEMLYAGIRFLPGNRQLLSASGDIFAPVADFSVRLWDVETGAELRRFLGHTDKIWDMAVSSSGGFAVTASHDGTLRRWDLESGEAYLLADVKPQAPICCAISPDTQRVLIGMGKGTDSTPDYSLRLLDSRTGQELHRLSGHTEAVQDVVFSHDGSLALSSGQDRRLLLWDVARGELVGSLLGALEVGIRLALSPDGTLAAQGTLLGDILVWDIQQQALIRRLVGHRGPVTQVIFSRDGRRLYSASDDGVVCEWRIDRDLPALLTWVQRSRLAGKGA